MRGKSHVPRGNRRPATANNSGLMDKLRAMAFFCRVVEAKSFTAAAQSLDMVPSALSKIVAALEQDLGFLLLNRSTRRLTLTDEGAVYYDKCREIIADIEVAEGTGRRSGTEARGTLRVGLHPGLRFVVMTQLGRFLDAQPDLRIETVITNSVAAVIDDGLDLVLHIGHLADSSLVATRIGWTRPIVCASPAYLAARGIPTDPMDLSHHRAVIYARIDEASNTRWRFSRGEEAREVEVPVGTVLRDGVGLVDAVVGGCGVARPFDIAANHLVASGEVQEVLADWRGDREAVSIALASRARATAAKIRRFTEYVAGLVTDRAA
jgi:LysR family transcriptional regulator, regulator for bpeEF and oprC